MSIEELHELCLVAPRNTKSIQMTHDEIVAFKVMDKVFAATTYLNSDVLDELIKELLLHSVNEIVKKIPKKNKNN